MSQLHKDWKEAKDEAPKLAKRLKDGNAELALKDLYGKKFKSGLGDKLDQLAKAAKKLKAAQDASVAKPRNAKLFEQWSSSTKDLLEALSAVLRVLTEYKNAVNAEKKELGGVYEFLKKKLEGLQTSAEGLLAQGNEFHKKLDSAHTQAATLYQSVELKVRGSRSFSDIEWEVYLEKQVDPKVAESLPGFEFED
jgi:uncharacterized phage infection (PIP) family protein YhgE